jgi:hypothetical protein
MFAQFDSKYALPAGLTLDGEQVIYLSAAFLQAGYFIFLAFFVREVRPAGGILYHPEDIRSDKLVGMIRETFQETRWWHYLLLSPLPAPIMLRLAQLRGFHWLNILLFPWSFLLRFLQDVFGETRWWWIYLFVLAGALHSSGARNPFGTLMLVDQFHYSKSNIALTGLPVMILSNVLVTPFMAWYADRLPRIPVILLGGAMALSAGALYFLLQFWSNIPKLDLPPVWGMMLIALSAFVGSGALILLCFQSLRGIAPSANPRIWAWLLLNIKTVVYSTLTYIYIKTLATDGVPSITVWFLLMCSTNGISCLHIVTGPLLYDFMPKDKIGTLSSGFGLLNTALGAVLTTTFGNWIYYVSRWTSGGTTKTDYTSTYLLQILLGSSGLVLVGFIFVRMLSGRMIEYGKLDLNSNQTPASPKPAPAEVVLV